MSINDFLNNYSENIAKCIPEMRPKTSSIINSYEDLLNHVYTTYSKMRMRY